MRMDVVRGLSDALSFFQVLSFPDLLSPTVSPRARQMIIRDIKRDRMEAVYQAVASRIA